MSAVPIFVKLSEINGKIRNVFVTNYSSSRIIAHLMFQLFPEEPEVHLKHI